MPQPWGIWVIQRKNLRKICIFNILLREKKHILRQALSERPCYGMWLSFSTTQ